MTLYTRSILENKENLARLDFEIYENIAYCKKCEWSCDGYDDCIEHAWINHGVMIEGVRVKDD